MNKLIVSYEQLARNVAYQLRDEYGQNLLASLEAELQNSCTATERYDSTVLIPLATLLLNVTKFAWDIYRDQMNAMKAPPSSDALARRISLELKSEEDIPVKERDQIIKVVVRELLKGPPNE